MKEQKELERESIERDVENMESELRLYNKKVAHHERLMDGLERQIKLKLKLIDYFDDYEKIRRKEPRFAFEEDKEYLELDLEAQKLKLESDVFQLQSQRDDAELMVDRTLKEIERIKKALPEAKKKLSMLNK